MRGGSIQRESHNGKGAKDAVPRAPKMIVAVLAVALIVLVVLSVSLWSLERDYHDAKYKAQHALVSILSDSLVYAASETSTIAHSSNPEPWRLAHAAMSEGLVQQSEYAAWAIQVMYPENSTESSTFDSLSNALATTYTTVGQYRSNLQLAMEAGETYVVNETVAGLFNEVANRLGNLSALVHVGLEGSRDWIKDPFSSVKLMDLSTIRDEAAELENVNAVLIHLLI